MKNIVSLVSVLLSLSQLSHLKGYSRDFVLQKSKTSKKFHKGWDIHGFWSPVWEAPKTYILAFPTMQLNATSPG